MAVSLSHLIECNSCGEEYEGTWVADADTIQDIAEPPTALQTCSCGHQQMETYEGWTEWSGAG